MASSSTFFALTDSEVTALLPIVVCAVVSALAILFIAVRVGLVLFPRASGARPAREQIFFRTQLGLYTGCLLLSNLVSCLSGLLEAAWVMQHGIAEGPTCTTQATFMAMGDWSSAYFTCVIAVHTFNSLVMRYRQPAWVNIAAVTVGWASAIAASVAPAFIPGPRGPVYGNATWGCGYTEQYPVHQFGLHLLPIFLTVLISAVTYSLVFLVVRGTLSIRGGLQFSLDPRQRWQSQVRGFEEYHTFLGAIATSTLWYPLAYLALMLPVSVSLLLDLSGFKISWNFMVFAVACSLLLGLANVGLIYNSLRVLSPAFAGSKIPDGPNKDADVEKSFCSIEKRTFNSRTFNSPVVSSPGSSRALPTPPMSHAPSTRSLTPGAVPYVSGTSNGIYRQSGHTKSSLSVDTAISAYSLQRSITPVSQLNMELDAPAYSKDLRPAHVRNYSTESSGSLPPPPRAAQSQIRREPSMKELPPTRMVLGSKPGEATIVDDGAIYPSQRKESIASMFLARRSGSTRGSDLRKSVRRMASISSLSGERRGSEPMTASSPTSGGSYYGSFDESAPSPLLDGLMRQPSKGGAFRPPPTSAAGGTFASPVGWASLVTNAATSDGLSSPGLVFGRGGRKSSAPGAVDVPTALRPHAPSASVRSAHGRSRSGSVAVPAGRESVYSQASYMPSAAPRLGKKPSMPSMRSDRF